MSRSKTDDSLGDADHGQSTFAQSISRLSWQMGIAPTLGRRRVAAFFDRMDGPINAEQAWRMISMESPIDRSSVYRAIRIFCDAGLLVEIVGPDQKNLFQKRSASVEVSLYDVETGQQLSIPGGDIIRPIEQLLARHGLALAGPLEFKVRGKPLSDADEP